MARNACNCIYFHIQEIPVNVLFCMLAIGMYAFIVIGGGGGGGGIGRVENLWLASKLNSTVTMTCL